MDLPQPKPFLELVIHDLDLKPTLSALSAGYELGEWRVRRFAEHLMEWLPEFALSHRELQEFNHATGVEFIRRAAAVIYNTDKYSRRGEFGELLLHVVLRQVMNTLPAITKIYFKDSANDTVKGFDAVHVVPTDTGLQLWLGEAKFYSDLTGAIHEAVESVNLHVKPDYLRREFQAIVNKIDDSWPYSDRLKKLLDLNTSLDQVFDSTCVPVLLTYDSESVNGFEEASEAFRVEFEKEVRAAHKEFAAKSLPSTVQICLFLTPLGSKEKLISELHERLKAWQAG